MQDNLDLEVADHLRRWIAKWYRDFEADAVYARIADFIYRNDIEMANYSWPEIDRMSLAE